MDPANDSFRGAHNRKANAAAERAKSSTLLSESRRKGCPKYSQVHQCPLLPDVGLVMIWPL